MKKFRPVCLLIFAWMLSVTGCRVSPEGISLGIYSNEPGEIEGFPETDYGYIVFDTEQKKTVKNHNARKEFIPASVTKLFTSIFSREILGGGYSFTTSALSDGIIEGGILKGNLYIAGSGDPELSLEGILSLVTELKARHITGITGGFFYDETVFPCRDMIDSEMSPVAHYNPGISPLSFNGNIVYAMRRKNNENRMTSCDLLPSLPSFSSVLYSEIPVYPYIRFKQDNTVETWELPQKIYWNNRLSLPVKNPGLYTAGVFRKLCEIQGIKLPSPVKKGKTSGLKILAEYKSRPLDLLIRNMLVTSNNLTAELLYITAAEKYSENHAGAAGDNNMIEKYYAKSFPKIKWENFRIANASGLTTRNRATPEQTAAVLLFMEKTGDKGFMPEKILPVSGWDGTMRGRLDQPDTAFRVYAKTGNIFYATALAGIFYANSGKKYIFSIYVNDVNKRVIHDSKNEKTISDTSNAGRWSTKGMASIDRFIRKMINEL